VWFGKARKKHKFALFSFALGAFVYFTLVFCPPVLFSFFALRGSSFGLALVSAKERKKRWRPPLAGTVQF
jgi:hypothetical protein